MQLESNNQSDNLFSKLKGLQEEYKLTIEIFCNREAQWSATVYQEEDLEDPFYFVLSGTDNPEELISKIVSRVIQEQYRDEG